MDILLCKFFEPARWQYAIDKGELKDISKAELITLTDPMSRIAMKRQIESGQYLIAPPHTALIPKDEPGEFRTVYVNEPRDRIFLSILNDLLFDLMPDMVHPHCKSYLRGVGCAEVVMDASRVMTDMLSTTVPAASPAGSSPVIGFKSDLRKYFDSVPIEYIDAAFDRVEERYGHSSVIDVIRNYYHQDLYLYRPEGSTEWQVGETYQSLKQGCSVASWLADVILYDVDVAMSQFRWYRRYSDDILCFDDDPQAALATLKAELAKVRVTVNDRKTEFIDGDHWFKFLGFSLRGSQRSLSKTRIKTFQREIEKRTIACLRSSRRKSPDSVINSVMRYLYKGDGEHSWATGVLRVINVKHDIDTLNGFALDAIRAYITGKHRIGGLGYVSTQSDGCISRGKGRNVRANRDKTGDDISQFLSLGCMRNALLSSRAVFDTLVRPL